MRDAMHFKGESFLLMIETLVDIGVRMLANWFDCNSQVDWIVQAALGT